MKFAHIADVHLGGWREPKLKELGIKTFRRAIKMCIDQNVAFILISGDLFDTSLPSIDLLKEAASILRKARDNDIEVYAIPGSHDFSPSGKTMLDVLEKSGLLQNVVKFGNGKLEFTEDKTGVKITGLYGKKGGLEINEYSLINKEELEREKGFKIFMFHTALEEFKPKELEKVEGIKLSGLPKNFDYYAGGHVHYIFDKKVENYGVIAFPGALFPNNFRELEEFKQGGFYIVDDNLKARFVPIKFFEVNDYEFFADDKSAEEVEKEIFDKVKEVEDKIIMLRVGGVLSSGKVTDLNFSKIFKFFLDKGAYVVLKNTNNLTTKEFEELEVEGGNVEEIEEKVIKEHLEQSNIFENEEGLTNSLMDALNIEKEEGERVTDFEDRLLKEFLKVFRLEEKWKA